MKSLLVEVNGAIHFVDAEPGQHRVRVGRFPKCIYFEQVSPPTTPADQELDFYLCGRAGPFQIYEEK